MLAEWLTYLLTPCPSHLRRMGYLREIIGTRSRYGRCHQAWASHLENTRKSILTAVKSVDSPETAVILGSGLLFDVPLTELSQAFANVVLVDIFHMPSVRRSAARYPNVTLIAHDLSGTVNRLSKAGPIRFVPTPSGNLPGADVDLLISANVLSQLPHLPSLFLAQVRPDVSETALQEFAASIVRHHLSQLEQAKGIVCFVSEFEHRRMDGDHVIDRVDPLFGVDPGPFDREWIWEIAPRPEIHAKEDVVYRVGSRITGKG